MIEVNVLNSDLELIGVVDSYSSLIWANRYQKSGDCEIYISASEEALKLLAKGNYLSRDDDDMVCRINHIQLETDAENGDYLTVSGIDVKSTVAQRVIWKQIDFTGFAEDFARRILAENVVNPSEEERRFTKSDGTSLFKLGEKVGFTERTSEQVTYKSVEEKIQDICKNYGWGYRARLDGDCFVFELYKGKNKSDVVVFSLEFENLISSKYDSDATNMGNVALVAGEGEGASRTRSIVGQTSGTDRYELYVDARDLSRNIAWKDFVKQYPLEEDGGQGYLFFEGPLIIYMMRYINILINNNVQLDELKEQYPEGEEITVDDGLYYRVYDARIAELPAQRPKDDDEVRLYDIIYLPYLMNRGYEKMAEFGEKISFEAEIEPNYTFRYKKDYNLGDIVFTENEYGISVSAQIVEIVESCDESGYSVEPKFEYSEVKNGREKI